MRQQSSLHALHCGVNQEIVLDLMLKFIFRIGQEKGRYKRKGRLIDFDTSTLRLFCTVLIQVSQTRLELSLDIFVC